jgi:hypothetical protein
MQYSVEEAHQIEQKLNLLSLLSAYGQAEIVGSAALDLIVKPDLDIHLLTTNDDLFEVVSQITRSLLEKEKVGEVRLSDYRADGGIKIGIDAYPAASGVWSIDIWVTNRIETTAFEFTRQLKQRLEKEERLAILAFKHHYYQQGQLRDGISLEI